MVNGRWDISEHKVTESHPNQAVHQKHAYGSLRGLNIQIKVEIRPHRKGS